MYQSIHQMFFLLRIKFGKQKVRFVKVIATNFGKLPE